MDNAFSKQLFILVNLNSSVMALKQLLLPALTNPQTGEIKAEITPDGKQNIQIEIDKLVMQITAQIDILKSVIGTI